MENLLFPVEVAEKIRVSEYTIIKWIKKGKLKGTIDEGKLKIKEKDFKEFIKKGDKVLK
ncbi:MAG: helix-turn-helix domain-containing protein [Candidatus Woesearchaeota archaeon]